MRLDGMLKYRWALDVLDYGFISCLVFAAVLGGQVVPFLIIFGLLPAIFLSFTRTLPSPAIPIWTIAVPVGLYLSYSTVAMFAYPGIEPDAPHPVNPDLEFYAVAALLFVLGLVRSHQISDLYKKTTFFLPWALFALFVILSLLFFLGVRDGCRVRGMASWPFVPALVFSTLTVLSFLGWSEMSAGQRRARLALVSMSITVVVGFTASRGITVGLGTVILSLCLASLYRPFKNRVPSLSSLVVASLIGAIVCAAIEFYSGCGVLHRLKTIWEPVYVLFNSPSPAISSIESSTDFAPVPAAEIAPGLDSSFVPRLALSEDISDSSTSLRLQMWAVAIEAIQEEPIVGHGAFSMKKIIGEPFGFEHPHNQFLAWMITGGLVTLFFGIIFLVGTTFPATFLPSIDRLFVFAAAPLLWSISMMFDSFLSQDFFLHFFCILSAFLFSLCANIAKKRGTDASQHHG